MSEGGGMGGGWIDPNVFLNCTQAYWSFRNIILGEKNRIEKLKEKKDKGK